jgi:hypothetical protein
VVRSRSRKTDDACTAAATIVPKNSLIKCPFVIYPLPP